MCARSAPLPALPIPSSLPGTRLPRGSSCSLGGGSPGSRPRQSCRSWPPSPPPRRLRGAAAGSMVPASPCRLRDRAGGTQSGGPSGKSLSKSRFQGTRNVSGSAARRLAMGRGWVARGWRREGGGRRGAAGYGAPRATGTLGEPQRGARDSNLRHDARAVALARRDRWLVEAHGRHSRAPLRPEVRASRRRGMAPAASLWRTSLHLNW